MIALFNFTLRQTLWSRKIWMTLLILSGPGAIILLIRNVGDLVMKGEALWTLHNVAGHLVLVSLLVPLVCMVYGTALIGTDVEARTIAYLITRRMRRSTVILVKFGATAVALVVVCDLAMIALHLCTFLGIDMTSLSTHADFADWSPIRDLYLYLMIIPVAVLAFLAVFTLIGLATARPLGASVLYLIVFELTLSNIPLRVRTYSVTHQLRVMTAGVMPRITTLFELPRDLTEELYPKGATALPQLAGIILIALALAAALATVRELTPGKISHE